MHKSEGLPRTLAGLDMAIRTGALITFRICCCNCDRQPVYQPLSIRALIKKYGEEAHLKDLRFRCVKCGKRDYAIDMTWVPERLAYLQRGRGWGK